MACTGTRVPRQRAHNKRSPEPRSSQQQFSFLEKPTSPTSAEEVGQAPDRIRMANYDVVPRFLQPIPEGMVRIRRDGRTDPLTGLFIRYWRPTYKDYTCTGDLDVDEEHSAAE